MHRELGVPLLALLAAVLVWGTTFVVTAEALDGSSPGVLTVARFAVAALVLVPLAVRRGGLRTALGTPSVALLGLTGVTAYYGLQNLGLGLTTPGNAALLLAVLPIATAGFAWALLSERPSRRASAGLLLATTGVALLAGGAALALDLGAALIVVGVLAYALYTTLLRRHRGTSTLVLATATCLWGLGLLLPWLAWELVTGRALLALDAPVLAAVAYLGLAASALTLLLWTYATTRVRATTAGVCTAAIPAVGYVVALLAGEQWSPVKAVGCLLALAGTVVVVTAGAATPSMATTGGSS